MPRGGSIAMPGYLGCFIDALARSFSEVRCFMHSPAKGEEGLLDYLIRSPNVSLINIGPHESLARRELLAHRFVRPLREHLNALDAVLLRGPSPLLGPMGNIAGRLPLVLLIVGDYSAGIKDMAGPWWRKQLIRLWAHRNHSRQRALAKRSLTFVNSRRLFQQLDGVAPKLVEIRTTTLTAADTWVREDTCQQRRVRLLYSGRVDKAKGLFEMIDAVAELTPQLDLVLEIAGWSEDGQRTVDGLKEHARNKGVSDRLSFLGYKSLGPELFSCYKAADIFVLASKSSFEGFPRAIWEAMAHSLPVVATRVGSIPEFVGDAAHLVPPNDSHALALAVRDVVQNTELRRRMIQRGRVAVKEVTLDHQVPRMAGEIENWARRN
jgi:glycosyltransferase involved in cell wall biosynthesis